MKIEQIELYHLELPLASPFETSFGRETTRSCILVAAHADGCCGWGECSMSSGPWYSYETAETAWHILRDVLIPLVMGQELHTPADVLPLFARVRGHPMARAALETSVWDLLAQQQEVSLATMLGGTRPHVSVGVSIGIEPSLDDLLRQVETFIEQGYCRVKLKIKPGWDVAIVRAVRERWPDLLLQVDANGAYTLADSDIFHDLDQFNLILIEQPLRYDDILDHAHLQAQIRTPICLDESIVSPQHARQALDHEACRAINVKIGRVGGLTAARQIHDLCHERDLPAWCGGMLETNIGRAANVALASLPGCLLPGDISASARYYQQDIAGPDFVLNDDSTLLVPGGPGLGVFPVRERLDAHCLRWLQT